MDEMGVAQTKAAPPGGWWGARGRGPLEYPLRVLRPPLGTPHARTFVSVSDEKARRNAKKCPGAPRQGRRSEIALDAQPQPGDKALSRSTGRRGHSVRPCGSVQQAAWPQTCGRRRSKLPAGERGALTPLRRRS
eukprot:3677744-Prymnesium_polylepis.1